MKRAWTLLETVMTLCFITMISAALLFWMYRYIKPDHIPLRVQQENQAHTMLDTLFSNLAGPLFFTSSQHSLIVSFDNQLNANPLLSDLIIGELYHDQDKSLLVLNLWQIGRAHV